MKKTFLYARVSTGMQSTGLEAQVRILREYCERMDIKNYVIFQDENQKKYLFSFSQQEPLFWMALVPSSGQFF